MTPRPSLQDRMRDDIFAPTTARVPAPAVEPQAVTAAPKPPTVKRRGTQVWLEPEDDAYINALKAEHMRQGKVGNMSMSAVIRAALAHQRATSDITEFIATLPSARS